MKSEKGITLMVLIVYIVVMCIVMAILATISNFFYANAKQLTNNSKYMAEYNKFNMYFVEDVKNNKDTYEVTENQVIFEDGTTYTYKANPDNSIYRNKVKICTNIPYCSFSKSITTVNEVEKKLVQVHMIIAGSHLFETNNEYVLKYW